MSQFFHALASTNVTFNEGFKAFFGFALAAIAIVGAGLALLSNASLSFGFGVACGMLGGAFGFVVANYFKRSLSER